MCYMEKCKPELNEILSAVSVYVCNCLEDDGAVIGAWVTVGKYRRCKNIAVLFKDQTIIEVSAWIIALAKAK